MIKIWILIFIFNMLIILVSGIDLDTTTLFQATNAINYWKYYKNFTININQDIINIDMKTTNYAYTLTQLFYPFKSTIYIDIMKFIYAPTSLFNVLLHEVGHFIGKTHTNDIKSIMNYSVKVNAYTGFIIEDNSRLLSKVDICT
jgi:hypothetical protein